MATLTDQQVLEFLSRLFPDGLGDAELLAEVCPDGWENSPLRLAFHPGPERRKQEEEHRRLQEGLEADVAEAKRQAWDEAPPAVVQAYQEVFGEDPSGWPPDPKLG